MNKYQETLDQLLRFASAYLPNDSEDYIKLKSAMQELVDLRKPKKLHYEGDGYADGYLVYDMAYCPNCGRFFEVDGEHFKNCPDCTQALDWTMEVVIGVDWGEE